MNPSGNPISHSTHVGFSWPGVFWFTTSFSGRAFFPCWLLLPDRQSRAAGVGQRFTAVASPSPLFFDAPLRLCSPNTVGVGHLAAAPFSVRFPRANVCEPFDPSAAIGVGHIATASSRLRRPISNRRCAVAADGKPRRGSPSFADGVGQDEQASSEMGRPDVGCSKHIPLRIEPEGGQIPENSIKPSNSESCDVFHEHEPGSKHANDASELGPQARAGAVDANASASDGDVLAGEAAADEIRGGGYWHQSPSRR